MVHYNFYRENYKSHSIEKIGEDEIYQDFIKETDREEAIELIYKLKINEKVELKDALYWAEEIE